jgi:DNA polymerase-3 subunit epsilon
MILAFDWETTSIKDPFPVQLGVILMTNGGVECATVSLIVQPRNWEIPDSAVDVHGITNELAITCGIPLVVVMATLTNLWSNASLRIAHNLKYDDLVTDRALQLLGRLSMLPRPPGVCTAELAAPIVNLPPTEKMIAAGRGDQPKTPSLAECYRHFFNEEVPGAHDALADARACARIYRHLKQHHAP